MPEISKIKLTSGDEYNIKDTTAREMISSHTHTNESMGFGYGACDTAASTTAKTVSISNYKLSTDGIVSIKFTYGVPANATLNINSTGDKSIYYDGAAITNNIINAGDTATFIYDGTNYNLISLDRDFNPITVDSSLSTTSNNPVQNNVITNALNNKADSTHTHSLESLGIAYGECDTAPVSSFPRTVSIDNFILKHNSIIVVKFNYDVPANATLNINNNGDKPIYYNGSAITYGIINGGDTATFIYDGTNYNRYYLISSINHTHSLESLGIAYTICDTAAASTDKLLSIDNFTLKRNSIIVVKFNYDVPANAYLVINYMRYYKIYYNGSTITDGIIKAGDTATFIYDGTNCNLISLDRDFDFNENSILKCNIDNSAPFGNTLPIYTSGYYTLNNIKYKVIIATFEFFVYYRSTLNGIPIYYNGVIQDNSIYPGDTVTFIYNVTNNRYEVINVDTKIDNDRIIIPYTKSKYFECTTDSATLAKSVYTNNSYNINENYIICVKFTNDVPANATLNINNNGDKPIYNNGSAIKNNVIKANDNVIFIYDGSKYKLMKNFNMTTVGNMFNLGYSFNTCIHSGICNTDASNTNKRVDVGDNSLTTYKFDKLTIKFSNAVPANSTLNNIPIYYNSAPIIDNIINAGDTVEFICDGSKYHLLYSYIDTSFKDINSTLNNKADSTHMHTNASMGQGYTLSNLTQNNNCIYAYSNNCIPTINDVFIIKFNNDVSENTMLNINDTGNCPIYCNSSFNSNREFEYINCGQIMMHCITNINGMIKSGDTVLIRCLLTQNNTKFYYAITSDSHNNENTNLYYAEINNISADISTTIENYILVSGSYITIKFNNDVPENATLNINNTDAVPIYYNNAPITDGIINAGDIIIFNYSNNRYNLVATDNYNNENINQKYAECLNENHFYHASLNDYVLSTGGIASIKFNNDVIADATLNINSTGAKSIYYKNSAITDGIINAGDTATFIYDGTNYNLISLDRDFNPITVDTALSTTSTNPVRNNVIANALNNKANSTHTHDPVNMGFGYGTCDTSAGSSAPRIVSIPDYKLTKGGIVSIKFTNSVLLSNPTLNINNTGAKAIYYNGAAIATNIIKAGDTATFIYDGTRYNLIAINNVINEHMGFGYGACTTAASTTAKIVSISGYKLTRGGIVSINFGYDVPADATLNINSTGAKPIFYNRAAIRADIIKAGDTATFIYDGTRYNLISLDRDFNITNESSGFGYSTCNTAASTTAKTVSMSGYKLTKNGMVSIEFDYDVPADATLNINDTGAKSIYYKKAAILDNIIKAGDIATFIYDGTNYKLISIL